MGKALLKAPPREKPAAPELAVVETVPGKDGRRAPEETREAAPPGKAARTSDAGIPRTTTSDAWRDLHPARVWPD